MATSTTNMSGLLDPTGTTITLTGAARGAMQLVLSGTTGDSARIIGINGVTEGNASTGGAIPANGIATPLIVKQGLQSIVLLPSSANVTFYLTPIVFAGYAFP